MMDSDRQSTSLIFIDAAVPNSQTLVQGITHNHQTILLKGDRDGIEQITQVLVGRRAIQNLHIVSHGSIGMLQLGTTRLTVTSLGTYADQLQRWTRSLTRNAEILLYSCNVATGDLGNAFVRRLSYLTGVNVAASAYCIGGTKPGGYWDLEVRTGVMQTPAPFRPEIQATYAGVLSGGDRFAVQETNLL
jgi:hypothetical protein